MPEGPINKAALFLSELNRNVQLVIRNSFPDACWLIAEISEMKVNSSGHCYLELIEKDPLSDKIVAKARGNIWAYTFRMLRPYFETGTRRSFSTGIQVMVLAQVEFHELYGLSLNITDIDPTYTLGDMARQRMETIERLHAEGVAEMNRELELPLVIQRIAVISSATAAGYGDFVKHISGNEYGYHFYCRLFPAIMQGDEAVQSIIHALETIHANGKLFEAVILIRGGGSQSDLSCFDNYSLANHIAQFPLPVITGIGHEQDESVADMVAHTRMKTPTAVADYIIGHAHGFEEYLFDLQSQFASIVTDTIHQNQTSLQYFSSRFISVTRDSLNEADKNLRLLAVSANQGIKQLIYTALLQLGRQSMSISTGIRHYLHLSRQGLGVAGKQTRELCRYRVNLNKQSLQEMQHTLDNLDPFNVLKRGYSITLFNNKPVKEAALVKPGDKLHTILWKGKINSTVEDKGKH